MRLIVWEKKNFNSRLYLYSFFIKGFLYHFVDGTGAFWKKTKLIFKRLWTLYLTKNLCIRTFICGRLQISQCRFNILSFEAISEKFWKAACTTLLLFVFFLLLEISVFNIEVALFVCLPGGFNRTVHSFPAYFAVCVFVDLGIVDSNEAGKKG